MNTFARAISALAIIMLPSAGAAFVPPGMQLPPSGDCKQIAAARGKTGFWLARFSGSYDDLFDHRWPVEVSACFETEYTCRRWINEVQTIASHPGAMSCRKVYSK